MLVHEEQLVLQYLRKHPFCSFRKLVTACMPGAPESWGERILHNLEWLGYISIFPANDGIGPTIQLTNRGKEAA